MNNEIIRVDNISKRYRIGLQEKADTFAGQIKNTLIYPFRNLSRIAKLSRFNKEEDESIFWALRDIDFTVKQGDVLGIIGHNGAGKSTLLKILSQITEPTTGEIEITGRVSSLLEVGTGFHPELTGRDNVYMNGTILGMTKKEIDQKFDEIIDFAGVEKHIDTPVKFYSSGMKVRLGFSVAAHLEPEILIIDEVLAVGDLAFQQKCLGKMDDVSKSGRTVLFVSHNIASIEGLCNRCILLEEGRITGDGDTPQVVEQYRSYIFKKFQHGLDDRKDRKGNGAFLFKNIIFNDDQNVIPGKPLKILIGFESFDDLNDVQIAITICKNFDERIMVIDSKAQNIFLSFHKGTGFIEISLPRLLLIPNTYVVNLWAGTGSDVYDYIMSGASLEVHNSDFYGSGNTLNYHKHGVVFPELCTWDIE